MEFLQVYMGLCYNKIMETDTRNLQDEYKGLANEDVVQRLAKKRTELEVAIENVSHDFNAGTIVRSANNFNVARVHIVGRRKYNRRGAMCTDKYLEVMYWADKAEFLADQRRRGREVVAIENNVKPEILSRVYRKIEAANTDFASDFTGVESLVNKKFVQATTLVFGSESDGISEDLLTEMDDIREIPGLGSTRSVNVGVAAGIAMYEWARQCVLGGAE